MMENDEMIYTAIFQTKQGVVSRARYTGVMNRQKAWKEAANLGEATAACLIALVPGNHPVHTYEELFEKLDNESASQKTQHPDPYDNVYEMT